MTISGSFLVLRMVWSPNDVKQKIQKTLNNTHTTTQKLTNNGFRNTKKHPNFLNSFLTREYAKHNERVIRDGSKFTHSLTHSITHVNFQSLVTLLTSAE